MSVTPIIVGAPQGPKTSTTGYAFWLPITATPPVAAATPLTTPNDVGFVGSEGVTLTSEIDTEMWQDWNLDDVLQINNGASSSIAAPIAGFTPAQAKLLYGADSVVEEAGGLWRVVFTGELPPHIYLVFELRGMAGHARLVAEAQVANPGEVAFLKNQPVTHQLTANLFKNEAFKDKNNKPAYWGLYMDAGGSMA